MQTAFYLLARYGSRADVPLEDVARDYLGLDARTAKDRAARGKLPFAAWRAPSQKAPWLVNIADLAAWIDRERERAERDRVQQVAA
jgi:hypothetical protein